MDWFSTIDSSWTLFLDRDGVINKRIMNGYVIQVNEIEFLDGVLDSIRFFSNNFKYIFVVTNQQGIAKGLMSERNLLEIHRYMQDHFNSVGGKITEFYYAPEFKNDVTNTRKPNPAMALEAKMDYPDIDFEKSIMVGDTDSDIQFGKNLGMKTIRIKTVEPIGVVADFTCNSLNEIVDQWKK